MKVKDNRALAKANQMQTGTVFEWKDKFYLVATMQAPGGRFRQVYVDLIGSTVIEEFPTTDCCCRAVRGELHVQ